VDSSRFHSIRRQSLQFVNFVDASFSNTLILTQVFWNIVTSCSLSVSGALSSPDRRIPQFRTRCSTRSSSSSQLQRGLLHCFLFGRCCDYMHQNWTRLKVRVFSVRWIWVSRGNDYKTTVLSVVTPRSSEGARSFTIRYGLHLSLMLVSCLAYISTLKMFLRNEGLFPNYVLLQVRRSYSCHTSYIQCHRNHSSSFGDEIWNNLSTSHSLYARSAKCAQ
jgi:hypothetical protein